MVSLKAEHRQTLGRNRCGSRSLSLSRGRRTPGKRDPSQTHGELLQVCLCRMQGLPCMSLRGIARALTVLARLQSQSQSGQVKAVRQFQPILQGQGPAMGIVRKICLSLQEEKGGFKYSSSQDDYEAHLCPNQRPDNRLEDNHTPYEGVHAKHIHL
jgi:hypothetical protein